jgi:hypothetical protein
MLNTDSLMPRVHLLLLSSLLSLALAHGPQVDVSELRVVATSEGNFLLMKLDPPAASDQLRLIAVATPSGPAQLEQRDGKGYRVVDRIVVSHESGLLGADTRYRVRLPMPLAQDDSLPVTILFSGGTLVQEEAMLTRSQDNSSALLAGAVIAVILATTTALVWSVRRGRQEVMR